jgi:hypothetical protein
MQKKHELKEEIAKSTKGAKTEVRKTHGEMRNLAPDQVTFLAPGKEQ